MTQDEYIADMKEVTRQLAALFADPQPGLFTWHMMVGEKYKKLKELMEGPK